MDFEIFRHSAQTMRLRQKLATGAPDQVTTKKMTEIRKDSLYLVYLKIIFHHKFI